MKRKHLCLSVLIALFSAAAMSATPQDFAGVQRAAFQGDYQAQRNLAYGYSSFPYKGQPKDPVLACAWRMVILVSGRADETDQGNFEVYCRRHLSVKDFQAAMVTAGGLLQQIGKGSSGNN